MEDESDVVIIIPVEDYERIVKLIETKNRALVQNSSRRIRFTEYVVKKDSQKPDLSSKIYENLGKEISEMVTAAQTRVRDIEKKRSKKDSEK